MRTALGVRDGFGKLLAAGLSFSVALQCFVVVGGRHPGHPADRPDHAVPLLGGSSLLANWSLVALLLRISDHARRPLPEADEPGAGRRRGPHRGGEAAVNAPVRRLSARRRRCSSPRCSSRRRSSSTSSRPRTSTRAPTTGAPCCRPTPASAARSSSADRRREVGARRRRVQVPAHLPRGPPVRPRHRLLLVLYGAGGGLEHAENALLSGSSPTSSSTAGSPTCSRAARPQGATSSSRSTPRRRQAADKALGQPARRGRGPRPEDRRDPRHGQQPALRPQRALQPRPQEGRGQRGTSSTPTPPSPCSTAPSPAALPPGLDVQDRHGGSGAEHWRVHRGDA